MPLEILHLALMLFGRHARFEGAEVAALAGFRVQLARIEPVLAGSQLADHDNSPFGIFRGKTCLAASCSPDAAASNPQAGTGDQASMRQISQQAIEEIADIIAQASRLPLRDAAFALWRQMSRLDSLEERYPSPEEVRINRAMSSERWFAKYRLEREHADEGPMFGYLKRSHPHAVDGDIKHAIMEAVRFDDACSLHFKWDGDFWDCVVRAVAQAAKNHPDYLDTTYRDARNNLAYLMK
jgi:hypothetical protein